MDLKIAWAAGLFEGEGTASYSDKTGVMAIALSSTDEDVVREFHLVVGCGHVNGPIVRSNTNNRPGHWKPQWRWSTAKWGDIQRIYELFKPWLFPRRCAQFEKGLAGYSSRTRKDGGRLSKEKQEAIKDDIKSGTHPDEIAVRNGVSARTVYRVEKSLIDSRKRRARTSNKNHDRDEVIKNKFFVLGMDVEEIAEEHGISLSEVRTVINRTSR